MPDTIIFEPVDCEGLATCLAEEAWRQETKKETEDELYETIVSPDVANKTIILGRQVKPHWGSLFFTLRESYLQLINHYKKEDTCNSQEKIPQPK